MPEEEIPERANPEVRSRRRNSTLPDWLPEIRRRLSELKLEPTREAAIIEELTQHLDDCYLEFLADDATAEEAYRQTLAELSGDDLLARELRRLELQIKQEPNILGTTRRTTLVADFWQDLHYGARMLIKKSAFTLIAVFTLALGIGANTAMFSVVNAVLLRPLPFPEPERLMAIDGKGIGTFAAPDFRDLATRNRSFAQLGAYTNATFNLSGGIEPERLDGARVSASLLATLGVEPGTRQESHGGGRSGRW
jgi:putative ABC transport system permease protein